MFECLMIIVACLNHAAPGLSMAVYLRGDSDPVTVPPSIPSYLPFYEMHYCDKCTIVIRIVT